MIGKYGRFGQLRTTLSPLPMPSAFSPFATWFAAPFNCAYVNVLSPK